MNLRLISFPLRNDVSTIVIKFGYQAIIETNFHFRDEIIELYYTLHNLD